MIGNIFKLMFLTWFAVMCITQIQGFMTARAVERLYTEYNEPIHWDRTPTSTPMSPLFKPTMVPKGIGTAIPTTTATQTLAPVVRQHLSAVVTYATPEPEIEPVIEAAYEPPEAIEPKIEEEQDSTISWINTDGERVSIPLSVWNQLEPGFRRGFEAVAYCESGMRPRVMSPNGLYTGTMQLDRQFHERKANGLGYTWDQMKEFVPNILVAQKVWQDNHRLWYPWPVCGKLVQ